jgi:hypothetical protein
MNDMRKKRITIAVSQETLDWLRTVQADIK